MIRASDRYRRLLARFLLVVMVMASSGLFAVLDATTGRHLVYFLYFFPLPTTALPRTSVDLACRPTQENHCQAAYPLR